MNEIVASISEQLLGIQISSLLLSEGRSLRAKEIQKALNIMYSCNQYSRRDINSYLYRHTAKYQRDEYYRWSLIYEPDCNPMELVAEHQQENVILFDDPALCKLLNQDGAKQFSREDFYAMADWRYGKSPSGTRYSGIYTTKTANSIEYGSEPELKMLEHLDECDLVEEIGGQSLCIPYTTPFRSDNKYFPDIVIYTTEGYIGIIEVKDATAMSNHTNLEKYDALENYCLENGYLYMMVDPKRDWLTVEELVDIPVEEELLTVFAQLEEQANTYTNCFLFSADDVNEWYDSFGKSKKKRKIDFQLQVHSMIIWEGWYNKYKKNGFRVYSGPVQ